MKHLPICFLALACNACGLFQAADVRPVVDNAKAKDAEFATLHAGAFRLLQYAMNNGATETAVRPYADFLAERRTNYDALALAQLAALAELGDVTLTEVFAVVKANAGRVKTAIDELSRDREGDR